MLYYSLYLHQSTKGDPLVFHHLIVESCRQVLIFLHITGQLSNISHKGLTWGEMNASTMLCFIVARESG